ncbi:hypothetical protein RSW25_25845, partial [Escherichia coli]|nr:hypothetical protein [Escherichia coli]
LARGFADVGFNPDNISHMSLRPRDLGGFSLRSEEVFSAFGELAAKAPAGCLFYFTSHGVPEGMVLGTEGLISPRKLNGL